MGIRVSNNLLSIVSLFRPLNLLIIAGTVFFSFAIRGFLPPVAITVALQYIFIAAAGYLVNDLRDIEADRINRPERALPSGAVSVAAARLLAGLLIALALACLFFLPGRAALFSLFVLVIAMLYDLSGNKHGFAGNTATAFMTASPVICTLFVSGYSPVIALLAVFAFLLMLKRELVKDLADAKGDRISGKVTTATRVGEKGVLRILFILTLIFLVATLTLNEFVDNRALYVITVVLICNLVNGFSLVLSCKGRYMAASLIYKINILIGMGGLWLSK